MYVILHHSLNRFLINYIKFFTIPCHITFQIIIQLCRPIYFDKNSDSLQTFKIPNGKAGSIVFANCSLSNRVKWGYMNKWQSHLCRSKLGSCILVHEPVNTCETNLAKSTSCIKGNTCHHGWRNRVQCC